jgi:light-regulated signal transduction histidine kinase (bacteriophytochrome)
VVGHDITERKQAEEALNEAYAALHARNAELDSFNYSVSHDLRGPLRTIGAFSRMLGDEYGAKLDDAGKGYLDQVLKSTDRMATIIDDLLKLSRLTKAEIKRTEVDLSSIAKALAQDLLKGNQKGNFQREVEFVIDDNIVIYADSGLMRIVMDNLFSNAWKFTSKRSQAKIEFSSKRKGGKTICFVRDNGDGFNMAHSKKLFTPFQRLHSESEFPGIGIGLAITRRIIERHGGKVWAESEPGSGATIYFEVPAGIDIRQIPPGGIGGNEP